MLSLDSHQKGYSAGKTSGVLRGASRGFVQDLNFLALFNLINT